MKELTEIPKENPFRVPDDYFSSLNDRIISVTSGVEPVAGKKINLFSHKRVMAIAATITILTASGIILTLITDRDRNSALPDDIALVSETYLYDIDILTIEESVAEENIFPEKTGVDKRDIIDYLVLENIDETDIYDKIE